MGKRPNFISLLLDEDGDGFFDALRYPISLPNNPSRDTIVAAAEISLYLSSKLLAMPKQPWTIINDNLPPATIYIGPPSGLQEFSFSKKGFRIVSNKDLLLLTADNPTQLLSGIRHFLYSSKKGKDTKKARGVTYTGFGLGKLFAYPSCVTIETADPRAIDAAARIALEQSTLITPDKKCAPKILLANGKGLLSRISRDVVRVAGEGLTYLARDYPRLPGGPDLTQLECRLHEVFMLKSPHGRIAALLAEQPKNGRVAYSPHPPVYSHQVFHVPVMDSSKGKVIRRWEIAFPWEGQRLQERIESLKFPPRAHIEIIATLGESQQVRTKLTEKLREYLDQRGHRARIILRSTLKPALCWLREEVLPQAQSRKADSLVVSCSMWRKGGLESPSRWLRDLYPLDALCEKEYPELKLKININRRQRVSYRVVALQNGKEVFRKTFSPPTTAKSYLPGDKRIVHPVCGWLTVRVNRRVMVNEPLPSDAEMFWDWYQRDVLQEAMTLFRRRKVFAELAIGLNISEPDEALNVFQERISGTEALHEDIYFVTLDAFKFARGEPPESRRLLTGRIIPIVNSREEQPTHAEIVLTAPGAGELAWLTSKNVKHPVSPLSIQAHVISVQFDGEARPIALSLTLYAKDNGAAVRALNRLTVLHELESTENIPPWELVLPRAVSLQVTAVVDGVVVKEQTLPALPPIAQSSPLAEVPTRPLSPQETANLTWAASTLPYVNVVLAGRSYQDRPILALELTYPLGASHHKLTLWKPTLLITARQHANEISSTNAALVTAHSLATMAQDYLKHINVVIIPLENPDGAQLYSALAARNPRHLLHAARYTALGADLSTAIWETTHPLSEGQVRHFLWRKWRPKVHLNDHGYAGHEWQQPFAGTVPYLFKKWSVPMGVVTMIRYTPRYKELALRFENTIATVFSELEPELTTQIRSALARWRRYQNPTSLSQLHIHVISGLPFQENMHVKQNKSIAFSQRCPSITPLSITTEVPDEGIDELGLAWCIRAHRAQHEAVICALLETLPGR